MQKIRELIVGRHGRAMRTTEGQVYLRNRDIHTFDVVFSGKVIIAAVDNDITVNQLEVLIRQRLTGR